MVMKTFTRIRIAIQFTFNYFKEKRFENEANKQIANYSYWNKIYVPAVHRETKPRTRLKQRMYNKKGGPKKNLVKTFKIHKPPIKCKYLFMEK